MLTEAAGWLPKGPKSCIPVFSTSLVPAGRAALHFQVQVCVPHGLIKGFPGSDHVLTLLSVESGLRGKAVCMKSDVLERTLDPRSGDLDVYPISR